MDKIKQYKKQIFTFITIFLLLEFGVYPCLTMANTFANIIGAVALLLLVLWGGLALYNYVRSDEGGIVDKAELDEAQKMYDTKTKEMLESELGPVIHKMAEEVKKPKRKYTKKAK
jgi:hypothetical protein